MKSLEQQIIDQWNGPSPSWHRQQIWEDSIWMHSKSSARADYQEFASNDQVAATKQLIRGDLELALLSPSLYVRTMAELLIKEKL